MTPDSNNYNPDPHYLRSLIERAGTSQARAAEQLNISPRTMRYYLSLADDHNDAPYAVQFCLEVLARQNDARQRRRGMPKRSVR